MTRTFLFCGFLFMLISMAPAKKTRIVFFGDSITQAAVKPGGYIDRLQNIINTRSLQDQYDLVGAGISGHKVYDLLFRMETDVLARDPQAVVIYVGINDVWHKSTSGTGTDIGRYEKFYTAMINKFKEKNIRVVVCTPTVIGEKKGGGNPQDKDLDAYSEVVRRLAASLQCSLVDLRKAFSDYENVYNKEDKESGILTTDRVHLNDAGNQLVADEMAKVLLQ